MAPIAGRGVWDIAFRRYDAGENGMFRRSGPAAAVKAARQAYGDEGLQWNVLEVSCPSLRHVVVA